MNALSDLSRLQLIIATAFVALNSLLLIPWRRGLKFMTAVAAACAAILVALSCYFYFFTVVDPTLLLRLLDVGWVFLVLFFAKYRDGRTIFCFISVWVFCVAGGLLAICCYYSFESSWVRLAISLCLHSIFPICIVLFIRKPLFAVMALGKKGWLTASIPPLLFFVSLRLVGLYPQPLSLNPSNIPAAAMVSISTLALYVVITKLMTFILQKSRQEQLLEIMETQSRTTEQQLTEVEQRERESAILRHDLRHFAHVISGSIHNNHYDDALNGVQGLLSHPAMREPEAKWCTNSTLNTLLSSYSQRALDAHATFQASVLLPEGFGVDIMDLAVTLSNLLENALNACINQPVTTPRAIRLKLHIAGEQLFISVGNSCPTPVVLDESTGLPKSDLNRPGHGIGMLSVQAFLEKYHAQADCTQENGWLQIRIVASPQKKGKAGAPQKTPIDTSVLRINAVISFLILGGFLLAVATSFISFNRLFKSDVELVSQLTSENIYANINSIMERPLNVAFTMANDTLLHELVLQEEQSSTNEAVEIKIQNYLATYQEKYQFDSVAFTSAKTQSYYHYRNGVTRILSADNPEDSWYFSYMQEPVDSKLNIDYDKVNHYSITIFVDCKVRDQNGDVLGVVGIGLKTPYIQELLIQSEEEYDLRSFLIDEKGTVQISSLLTEFEGYNLFADPRFAQMSQDILKNKTTSEKKWYSDGNLDGYIITKYIPNLNWYLIVEKDTADFQETMHAQLLSSLLFMAIVVFSVICVITVILTRYHSALVGRTERDVLTGLRNRTSYEQEMHIYQGRLADYAQFGLGLFDLNNLKRVNDIQGHQAGDAYIKSFGKLLSETFSHCPAFRIGGDEFLVVFINTAESEIQDKWDFLKLVLEQRSKDSPIPKGASFGYALRDTESLVNIDAIFREADRRMYLDKQNGKELELK